MKKSWIKRESKPHAIMRRVYEKEKAEYFKVHQLCEFNDTMQGGTSSNPCRKKAKDIHHKMGRGKYTADPKYFMAVCRTHHDWIEDNKKAARKRGYILYK